MLFPSGKYYIGQTTDFDGRMYAYKKLRCKRQPKLYYAIKKYGFDSIKVFFISYPEELLNVNEITLIRAYNSVLEGYNMTWGGEGGRPSEEVKEKLRQANLGKKASEETKRKQSLAMKGRFRGIPNLKLKGRPGHMKGKKHSDEAKRKMSEANQGDKNSFYGKKHSAESRKKISESLNGRKLSEEHKKKIRRVGENHPMYGRKHSEESLEKMRNKIITEETKIKMSLAQKGRKHTDEAKKKIGDASRGRKFTEEHKRKIGESNRRRHENKFAENLSFDF